MPASTRSASGNKTNRNSRLSARASAQRAIRVETNIRARRANKDKTRKNSRSDAHAERRIHGEAPAHPQGMPASASASEYVSAREDIPSQYTIDEICDLVYFFFSRKGITIDKKVIMTDLNEYLISKSSSNWVEYQEGFSRFGFLALEMPNIIYFIEQKLKNKTTGGYHKNKSRRRR